MCDSPNVRAGGEEGEEGWEVREVGRHVEGLRPGSKGPCFVLFSLVKPFICL